MSIPTLVQNKQSILSLLFLFYFTLSAENYFKIITNGGYVARFCIEKSEEEFILLKKDFKEYINCSRTKDRCDYGYFYSCPIPCKFRRHVLFLRNSRRFIHYVDRPKFKLSSLPINFEYNNNLTIIAQEEPLKLLHQSQIKFSFPFNISCKEIKIYQFAIICTLNLDEIKFDEKQTVNVTVEYGSNCNEPQNLGKINIIRLSLFAKLLKKSWIIVIVFILLLSIFTIFYQIKRKKIFFIKSLTLLESHTTNINTVQQRGFLELESTSFLDNDIRKFSPLYVLPFHDFMMGIFNWELNISLNDKTTDQLEEFKKILLNEETLLQWIDKVEANCRAKEKCLMASFLTIFLFPYPDYFLKIMKMLLIKLVTEMKAKSEESYLFSRSEYMIEKVISYWITLCLFDSFKGPIGKKFFKMCRNVKCKIESGLVDMCANKSKYSLNFDNLLLGDLQYEILTLDVNVEITLTPIEYSLNSIKIEFPSLKVNVLSLDSISQVKEKIIDKAITTYVESEHLSLIEDEIDLCFETVQQTNYKLQFIQNNIKIELKDFDDTSIVTSKNNRFIFVNTMKHYNIKNDMKFILCPAVHRESISLFTARHKSFYLSEEVPIHLQIPNNVSPMDFSEKDQEHFVFDPIIENANRDSYLMMLMATKKSLILSINSFIKSITNYKETEKEKEKKFISMRTNSLYFPEHLLAEEMKKNFQELEMESNYISPIYYIFSLFDDIGEFLLIEKEIIQEWKSKSFIQQVWVNLIKNPNFVFSMNLSIPMYGSFKTIAKVLLESCSMKNPDFLNSLGIPVSRQLFRKEIISMYSPWWRSFVDSEVKVSAETMETIMYNISEKNLMNKYKVSCLRTLQMLSKTILLPSRSNSTNYESLVYESLPK